MNLKLRLKWAIQSALCFFGQHKDKDFWGDKSSFCGHCGKQMNLNAYSDYIVTLTCGKKHSLKAVSRIHAKNLVIYDGDARMEAYTGIPLGAIKVHPKNIQSVIRICPHTQAPVYKHHVPIVVDGVFQNTFSLPASPYAYSSQSIMNDITEETMKIMKDGYHVSCFNTKADICTIKGIEKIQKLIESNCNSHIFFKANTLTINREQYRRWISSCFEYSLLSKPPQGGDLLFLPGKKPDFLMINDSEFISLDDILNSFNGKVVNSMIYEAFVEEVYVSVSGCYDHLSDIDFNRLEAYFCNIHGIDNVYDIPEQSYRAKNEAHLAITGEPL